MPVVVCHEHSWEFTGQRLRQLADRYVIGAGSDALITCSLEDRRRMVMQVGLPERLVRYIPNGIQGRAPAPGRDVRAELGIAPDVPVIGTVGLLRPEKRFDVLLRALAALRLRVPNVRLLVVGEGPERPVLETLIADLDLDETVSLLGRRDDVPDILAAFDVATLSSDREGAPLSLLEYMEAGLAVVATAVGDVPRIVLDGEHGVLVPRRDPGALADALAALVADPARRAELGAAARARRRKEFDLGVMVGRIEALYGELLDGAVSRGWAGHSRRASRSLD